MRPSATDAKRRPSRDPEGTAPLRAPARTSGARAPDPRAFVVAHTRLGAPPLVPEIELRLGGEVLPLWEACEAWLGRECPPPFWAFAWAGGQALARLVLDEPMIVRGRRVLDFGAGSGIVAIAALRAGAAHVRAVDIDPLALAACAVNAEANRAELELRGADVVGSALDDTDVVLAGDMFYERGPSARFWQWLCELPRRGKAVWLGDPGRNYLPEGLEPRASYAVTTTRDLEGRDSWNARVWQVPV